MVEYFKMAVTEKYADFKTRSSRSEYWYFTLFNFIVYGVLLILFFATASDMSDSGELSSSSYMIMALYGIYALAMLIPSIAVLVRRLHDTGKSGWFYFISFIPLVGPLILLFFLCTDSKPGTNQWGPNPYELDDGYEVREHLVKEDLV